MGTAPLPGNLAAGGVATLCTRGCCLFVVLAGFPDHLAHLVLARVGVIRS